MRVYTPEGEGPFPLLVYFHGGGWVLGNLDTHDPLCRALANESGCVVVSVDYRLAPEHRFPAAVEDCYAAAGWVAANAALLKGDPKRVAIGGDSAGGNLAAAVALKAQDQGGPALAYQLLLYPITNYSFDTVSYRENARGYLLSREDMVWYWDHYLGPEGEGLDPYASPLRAEDLRGLPPALVITAEYDPLRDEGEAFAARLAAAGVPVTATRYDGLVHGFLRFARAMGQGRRALEQIGEVMSGTIGN